MITFKIYKAVLFYFHRFVEALLETELIAPISGIFGNLLNALPAAKLRTSVSKILKILSAMLSLPELSCELSLNLHLHVQEKFMTF